MIQDISPLHLYNQYMNKLPKKEDYVLWYRNRECLLKNNNEIQYITYGEIQDICSKNDIKLPELTYMFSIDDNNYYLADLDDIFARMTGYEFYKMFDLRRMQPKESVYAATTGYHLYTWYSSNRFCGRCGCKTLHDNKERMLRCPNCNNMIFPKIVPAVIVAVTNGDEILLTKYAGREYTRYALIAGFTEIGETIEETVAREVMEEVGLKVKNITYYKSQPWGFDSDLLVGFFCELDDVNTIHMDTNELSVACWVNYKDMPEYNEGLSLTEEMMNLFKHRCLARSENNEYN